MVVSQKCIKNENKTALSRKMKKNNKTKPKTSFFKKLSKWWLVILFLGYFIYTIGEQSLINYKLNHYGKCTKAVVYDRYFVGSKGTVRTKYKFKLNNNTYTGTSSSDDKFRQTDKFFVTEDDLVTGDTIVVVYLESNPDINRSNYIVEKNCDCIKFKY